MKDYHHTWYNNPEWEFKYILSVAKKPRFKNIDNIEKHIDEVKEVKGDYDVVQEKSVLVYENAVFVHEEDSRTRFVLRDDLMDYNVSLSKWHGKVTREDVEDDKIVVEGQYYPYAEDVIPDLEHRDFNGRLDKIKAFFKETPVKQIESESEFLGRLSVRDGSVLRKVSD